jgi:hypothetical protein
VEEVRNLLYFQMVKLINFKVFQSRNSALINMVLRCGLDEIEKWLKPILKNMTSYLIGSGGNINKLFKLSVKFRKPLSYIYMNSQYSFFWIHYLMNKEYQNWD